MGIGETAGPQKKRMKQAQLPFCFPSEKVGSKRKLNEDSINDTGHAVKVIRKDSNSSEEMSFNKENVKVNSGSSSVVDSIDLCSDDDVKSICELPPPKKPIVDNDVLIDEVKTEVTVLSDEENEISRVEDSNETPATPVIVESNEVESEDVKLDKKPASSTSLSIDDVDKSSLDVSLESNQGDLTENLIASSEEESFTKKSPQANKRRLKDVERVKRQEEKKRIMLEKKESKMREKAEREKKKIEEMKLKEDDRKRKEVEKKKKEEAKEEEKRKKEEEKRKKEEAKEEEKRKKEEERRKKEEVKEEDRKKKEEARLAEERKENLAKLAFTKFFIPSKSKTSLPKKEENVAIDVSETCIFMPFPLKNDMRLAPQTRRVFTPNEKSIVDEHLLNIQTDAKLYLDEIKIGGRVPLTSAATWPLSEEQHDVIIVESMSNEKMDQDEEVTRKTKTKHLRAKLIQFHDNRRPPYWGTWRKKSWSVTPRKPFGLDKALDYEVDSDSEWEDEDEGEDIDKEQESDKEQSDDENVGENGYLLDKTFVPHGYLSDEEAAEEDELNPEDMKLKMKVLKQEFEQDIKTKAQHLKPRLLGCVWISNDTTEVSKGSLYETLLNFRCRWTEEDGPVNPFEAPPSEPVMASPANSRFPSSLVERLVKVVHGSRSTHPNLVTDFMATLVNDKNVSTISKRSVKRKIKDIAAKAPDANGRLIWKVNADLCAEFKLEPIPDSKGAALTPSPTVVTPKGTVVTPKGTVATPKGTVATPKGTAATPKGTLMSSYLKKGSEINHETPPVKKRLTPISLAFPPKPTSSIVNRNSNTVVATSTPTHVRKRIQPITLSKTVTIRNPKSEEPTSAIKSFFEAPVNKATPSSTADVIEIDDSN